MTALLLLVGVAAREVAPALVALERRGVSQLGVEVEPHSTVRRDRGRDGYEDHVTVLVTDSAGETVEVLAEERSPPPAPAGSITRPLREAIVERPATERAVVERPAAERKHNASLVRLNSSKEPRKSASLAQVETLEAQAAVSLGPLDMLGFGIFRKLGKVGAGLCACVLGAALVAYLQRVCCGEKSCWYTWPCCRKARLKLGMDSSETITLEMTIHRARDLGTSHAVSIAVIPRRGTDSRKKPKLKADSVITAATDDLKWEQPLKVVVEQGCSIIHVAAFKKALLGKGTLLGWGHLKVVDLMQATGDKALNKEWVPLQDDSGQPIGSIAVTVIRPQRQKDPLSPKAVRKEPAEPTEEQQLEAYTEALTGPLNQANEEGSYKMRYFRIEQKRGVWIWAWYKDKRITRETKAIGRIPLVSISTIYEVPHSIAEFIVRYRDATDTVVDMMLKRTDRPRELWVKTLHSMIGFCRTQRKRGKQERDSRPGAKDLRDRDSSGDRDSKTSRSRGSRVEDRDRDSSREPGHPRTAHRGSMPAPPPGKLLVPGGAQKRDPRLGRAPPSSEESDSSASSWAGSHASQPPDDPKPGPHLAVPRPQY